MDIIPQTCSINSYRSCSIPDNWFWKILLIKGFIFFFSLPFHNSNTMATTHAWNDWPQSYGSFGLYSSFTSTMVTIFFGPLWRLLTFIVDWVELERILIECRKTKITVITKEFQKKGKYLCESMRTQSETKQTAGKCGRPNRDWIKVSDWLRLANHRTMYRETNANSDSSSTNR